jgi:uncharacterized protein GlcG (DUF336 family)
MLSLSEATRVLAAAEEKAISLGRPMNICVTDEGGHIVAHVRMDGAWRGGVELAIRKAYTACAFETPTKDLVNLWRSNEDHTSLCGWTSDRMIIAAGGVPLRRNGRITGAIGVSGGTANQEQSVAEAAARTFTAELGNGQHRDTAPHEYQPAGFGQKVLSRSAEERQ